MESEFDTRDGRIDGTAPRREFLKKTLGIGVFATLSAAVGCESGPDFRTSANMENIGVEVIIRLGNNIGPQNTLKTLSINVEENGMYIIELLTAQNNRLDSLQKTEVDLTESKQSQEIIVDGVHSAISMYVQVVKVVNGKAESEIIDVNNAKLKVDAEKQ